MAKLIGIYSITSPDGKVYIGQSWDINDRWSAHRKGSKHCKKLIESLLKFGCENHIFKVCHELPKDTEQSVLNKYEQLYMDAFRDVGIELLNLREGGGRGRHSEESKLRMSNSNKGRIISEEAKAKMSLAKKGKRLCDKAIINSRLSRIGKKMPIESVIKSSIARAGVKRTEETKRKLSEIHKGKPWSEARREAQNNIKNGKLHQ